MGTRKGPFPEKERYGQSQAAKREGSRKAPLGCAFLLRKKRDRVTLKGIFKKPPKSTTGRVQRRKELLTKKKKD